MFVVVSKILRSCSLTPNGSHPSLHSIKKFSSRSKPSLFTSNNKTMASFDSLSPSDRMTPFDASKDIYWFHEVGSTMDKARELLTLEEYSTKKSFVVVGDYQTAGRGTRGRSWVSTVGNLYMTVVINMSDVPLALTLTPIRIGTFIIRAIDRALGLDSTSSTPPPLVQLKWPNDVIINGDKVSGVLIEIENGKLLIGIGCNIATAPVAPEEGPDSGCRAATHLSAHTGRGGDDQQISLELRNIMATELYDSAQHWVSGSSGDTEETAIDEFHLRMDDSWQVLRRDHHFDQGFECGDEVKALRLNKDGTLVVLHKKSNTERTLTAEYLR